MPGGLLWKWIFARSFALINMEEDSPAVSKRWSPLRQSEDFSALLLVNSYKYINNIKIARIWKSISLAISLPSSLPCSQAIRQ